MGKTTVVYKDVAVGAAEAASVTVTGPTPESVPAKLPFGKDTGAVVTLEHNRWILDGSMDRWYEEDAYAFWSAELSGADGSFEEPPTITIAFSQQFSSMGVSFTFDAATGEYCSALNIKWYQGNTLKADQDFSPDSAQYFCEKKVESYNKLVITIQKTSLPYRRAKIDQILFGIVRIFGMEELRNASIVNEMDEVAIELPVSSFSWTLDSLSDVEYMFQLKQPVEVHSAAGLLGVYYISSSSRQAASLYDIKCNDALGVLSETQFPGGAYPFRGQRKNAFKRAGSALYGGVCGRRRGCHPNRSASPADPEGSYPAGHFRLGRLLCYRWRQCSPGFPAGQHSGNHPQRPDLYRGGGGGSGFVWTAATAGNVPAGYLLGSEYYLTDASTTAGNVSFTGPTGAAETGHSGDGYARVTVLEIFPQGPETPTGFRQTAKDYFSIGLSWDASADAAGYKLYRGGALLATLTATSYTDSAVEPGQSYVYTLVAYNTEGESDPAELTASTLAGFAFRTITFSDAVISVNPCDINSKTVLSLSAAETVLILEPEHYYSGDLYSGEV